MTDKPGTAKAINMTWRGKPMGEMTSGQLLDALLVMAHREAAYEALLDGYRREVKSANDDVNISFDAYQTIKDELDDVSARLGKANATIDRNSEANQCLRMEEVRRHHAALKKAKTPFWTTFMQVFFCVCVGYSLAYIGQHLDVFLIRCELPVWELNKTWWP